MSSDEKRNRKILRPLWHEDTSDGEELPTKNVSILEWGAEIEHIASNETPMKESPQVEIVCSKRKEGDLDSVPNPDFDA